MSRRGQSKRQPERKIRYAVIGLGHIAQVAVLPAFKNAGNSELFALVSGDSEKLKKLGEKYKIAHRYAYDDYSRALGNVDAVYLALPNHLHREYAVRAAAAGVHVLCEKPMAVTEEDCHAMITAAEQNNAKLMIAYRLHFEAQQVRGDNVRVTEFAAQGGGPLFDMGVYCINAARYLFGTNPTEVFAVTANNGEERFRQVEEMTSVVMRFPQDRIATFTCSFGAADVSRYSLIGTKGVLRVDPAYEYAMGIEHQLTVGGRVKTRTFPKRDQFAAELAYFSDCILKNKEPEPSGLEGLADIRIVQAIYESARLKEAVSIAPVPSKKRPNLQQEIHRPAHGKPQIFHAKPVSREAA
jgi:glucose-fructose oxidoreductase